jgi:prevent-host-death family protein
MYMDVGVRELKQQLSRYLARVARGETIRVTDRGVPKAILAPLPAAPRLEEGVSQGWISAPSGRVPPPARVRRARSGVRVDEALAEDRGE